MSVARCVSGRTTVIMIGRTPARAGTGFGVRGEYPGGGRSPEPMPPTSLKIGQ